jgi:hypothetical protein
MSVIADNITIKLFGLEHDLWEQTNEGERTVYNRAMYCFMIFLLLAFIASCMLVYLIAGNVISSIPGGILVSLIIGSIVRFSMIILRRSIFDELKLKQQATPIAPKPVSVAPANQPATTNQPVAGTTANAAAGRFAGIKKLFSRFSFKLPGAQSKVPGFAGFIRLIIMTVMGLLVLFPLATLLHKSRIDQLNEEKRQVYVQEFEKDATVALTNSLSLLMREKSAIQADLILNAGIYQTDGLIREKKLAIARIDSLMQVEKADHAERYAIQYEHFQEELEGQYFLSLSFRAVTTMPFFILTLLVIAFLLIYPHFLLYRLKTNQSYKYSTLSTDHYRSIIDEAYEQTEKAGYALLKSKYGYERKGYDKDVYWENPPYNTKPHQPFAERKPVTKEKFLESFEPKTTV